MSSSYLVGLFCQEGIGGDGERSFLHFQAKEKKGDNELLVISHFSPDFRN